MSLPDIYALLSLLGSFAYFTMAVGVGKFSHRYLIDLGEHDTESLSAVAGIVWPITLFIMGGWWSGKRISAALEHRFIKE